MHILWCLLEEPTYHLHDLHDEISLGRCADHPEEIAKHHADPLTFGLVELISGNRFAHGGPAKGFALDIPALRPVTSTKFS